MTWLPGRPVTTEQDRREWEQWRKDRKRDQQRARRATCKRIDYYPDDDAATVIAAMSGNFPGGDYSSVLNRILWEWKHRAEALPPE